MRKTALFLVLFFNLTLSTVFTFAYATANSFGQAPKQLNIIPKIYKGSDVTLSEFSEQSPFMAALVKNQDFINLPNDAGISSLNITANFTCGATLIAPNWALAAAHCISADNTSDKLGETLNNEHFRLVFGRLNLSNGTASDGTVTSDFTGQVRKVTQIIRHPNYSLILDGDLALLELEAPIFNIPPVRLAPESFFDLPVLDEGAPVLAIGWGRTKFDFPIEIGTWNLSDTLQKAVNLTVGSQKDCRDNFFDTLTQTNPVSPRIICTIDFKNNSQTLPGDSGSPLLANLTSIDNKRWTQIGITSFGNSDGASSYSGFTRVSPYIPWIESNICNPQNNPGLNTFLNTEPKFTFKKTGTLVQLQIEPVAGADFYRIFFRDKAVPNQIPSIDLDKSTYFEVNLSPYDFNSYEATVKAYQNNCGTNWSILSIKSI